MNLVRHELGLSDKAQRFPLKATCLAIYSRAVNAAEPLEAVLRKQFPWCAEWKDELRELFAAYVEAKQTQHVLDYDDLLLYWGELMQVPELAGRGRRAASTTCWSTSTRTPTRCRPRSCCGLKPDGAGLTVVGDDAQAIYGFRAANVRNILDFPAPVPAAGRRSSRWSRTTARRSRSWPPPTPSSASPASASPRTCARTAAPASKPALVTVPTTSARSNYVVETDPGEPRGRHRRSRSRRCCSAPRTTAPCWRSS